MLRDALGSPVGVIDVGKAPRTTEPPDRRAPQCQSRICTDSVAGSADGSRLRRAVKLPLAVASDIAGAIVRVAEDGILQGQVQDVRPSFDTVGAGNNRRSCEFAFDGWDFGLDRNDGPMFVRSVDEPEVFKRGNVSAGTAPT